MELHYSCGAWHPIPPREPPFAAADRPAGARDRRASPLRPARILSLRPPNRPSQSQRKHLESNLEGGRKEDRQRGRSGRAAAAAAGRVGRESIPSVHPLLRSKRRRRNQILSGRPFSVLMSTIDGAASGPLLARVRVHGSLEPFLGRNQSLLGKPITGH